MPLRWSFFNDPLVEGRLASSVLDEPYLLATIPYREFYANHAVALYFRTETVSSLKLA